MDLDAPVHTAVERQPTAYVWCTLFQDLQFHRYAVDRHRLLDATYDIKDIVQESVYKTALDGFIQASRQQLASVVDDMYQSVGNSVVDLSATINSIFADVAESVDSTNSSSQSAGQQVEQLFMQTESVLVAETNSLDIARRALPDRVAATLTSLVNAIGVDAQDTMRVISEDQSYTQTILDSMSQQVVTFASTETARASTKAASLDALAATTPSQLSTTLSSALKSQVTVNNAQASTKVSAMAVLAIASRDGSTDTTTWYAL
jgi:hypothetical protein